MIEQKTILESEKHTAASGRIVSPFHLKSGDVTPLSFVSMFPNFSALPNARNKRKKAALHRRIPNGSRNLLLLLFALATVSVAGCANTTVTSLVGAGWAHEQQNLAVRDPATLAPAPLPAIPPPPTVAADSPKREPFNLSLNDAVRISLENSRVVRVFTGLGATNSGRTIYDPSIANTRIDQAQARFDPTLTAGTSHIRDETPNFGGDVTSPFGIGTIGARGDTDRTSFGIEKVNLLGGTAGLGFTKDTRRLSPIGANISPVDRSALEANFTQPLLQGGGFQFNMSPIVLARIETDRSYFQFKDATQDLVRGTIEAYWNLVLARLELWAREIVVERAEYAYKLEEDRRKVGRHVYTDLTQAKVSLAQFQASLIAARANVLDREAALRNLIGLPPSDGKEIVPVSTPANLRYKAEWENLLRFAEQRRPDLIELKLVLEADQQRRIQAENTALPRLDATALYRWNGLAGTLPSTGQRISSDHGQFTDWTVGINFSVPLGLREGRARVREQDLIILRDRANLEQGLHSAGHELAITTRSLESSFEQYLAYRATRTAALENLIAQDDLFKAGKGVIYLQVLQALNDWGTVITSEARALIDYNVLLATLERQTGTILETHGLVFVEERFQAAGPLCLPMHDRAYSMDLKPTGEPTQYPATGSPSENAFDLKRPTERPAKLKDPEPGDRKVAPKPPLLKFAEDQAK